MAVTRVTGSKWLKDLSVTEGKIADLSISTGKIKDDAVTPAKLQDTGDFTVNSLSATTTVGALTSISAGTTISAGTGFSVATNKFTVDANGNVVVAGNLQVDGDNIIANVTTLEVEDKNIVISKGGNAAAMTGSGISIDNTEGTNGSLIYDASSSTKWKIGNEGTEVDVVDISTVQTLSNKTYDIVGTDITVDGSTYTDVEAALRALASVAGNTVNVLEGDETSAAYDDVAKTITVPGATAILAVYCSGLRMKSVDDYTVSGNVITLTENLLGNFIVEYKRN